MGKRLLIVEDEATLARAVARLLRKAGYEVFLAGSCEEARRAPGTFSLGVFDLELPDGDGVSLAGELGRGGAVRRTVFFTGSRCTQQRKLAGVLGPLVDKSRGFHQLEAVIQAALASQRAKVAGAEDVPDETSDPPPSGVNGRS